MKSLKGEKQNPVKDVMKFLRNRSDSINGRTSGIDAGSRIESCEDTVLLRTNSIITDVEHVSISLSSHSWYHPELKSINRQLRSHLT